MAAKFKVVDYGGCITSLAATVLLLIGLTWGGVSYPWVSAHGKFFINASFNCTLLKSMSITVLAPMISAAVLFVAFLFIEGRVASHPIIPLRVFTNVTSAGVLAATFLLGAAY